MKIFGRVINFCWFCFKWTLLLGAVGVAAVALYLDDRVDEEIRRRVVERLARHYAGLKVTVRSAELVRGEGIKVRDLSIVEPGAEGPRAELLSIDEIRLDCGTDLQELIRGELEITHVRVRQPTLRVTRRPDGTWSAIKLLPLPKFSDRPPEVTIENGTIEVFDPLKNPSSTLVLRDVNLRFGTPDDSSSTSCARKLQGTFVADHLRQVEVQGIVDPQRQTFSIGGSIEGLDISPELRGALPGPLCGKLVVLGELRGQGTLSFRVSCDNSAEAPYRFELSGRLKRGRMDDPRLPHPLTDMRATVRMNNEGFAVDELVARSGQATLRMSAHQAGFEPGSSPLALTAEIRQLELDRQLLDILPEAVKDQWCKYRPAGTVDADLKLSFDGKAWHPRLSVRCLNVSFTHHKFPYRLEHGKGSLELGDDTLQLNLTAHGGPQPVRVAAKVTGLSCGPTGWFEARGDELQIDEKLLIALPERSRAVVRALNPRGTISFLMRMLRDSPQRPLQKHLLIGVNRCSIRYEKFPYPLGNIRGTIEMLDDNWTFRDLEGTNDTGRVTCEGHLSPTPQGQELFLRFVGTDVPLEEELRDALRPNVQRAWNHFRPHGAVDLVAEVRYLCDQKRLSVGVRAEPQCDSTSICPVYFPYRMDKLRGVLVYRDGHVELERLKAEHGPVKMAAAGQCNFLPDGSWNFQFRGLSVDRLRLDRELVQALPGRLKKMISELKPTGSLDLRGSFGLEGGARPGDPVRSQWDLAIGFQQGSIDCGIKLENLHGSVTLAGGFDGRHFHSQGELAIDSLTYKDYQFTQVTGPVWIDDQQVLLGSWVARRQNGRSPGRASSPQRQPRQQPRPLCGKFCGGTVFGDGWIALGPVPKYGLHATLSQAELSHCAKEVMAGQQNLRGKITATLDLRGAGRSVHALEGRGNIRLREADVYELPLMIALLKILSIREPDRNAFTESDADFRIQGNHIYFDRLNFTGDAISLEGRGEMDFQSAIRLTFRARLGRDRLQLPVLRELLGEASEQIMLIRVGGTLQNPVTRKEAFPGVNQALQQLQNDLQGEMPNQRKTIR